MVLESYGVPMCFAQFLHTEGLQQDMQDQPLLRPGKGQGTRQFSDGFRNAAPCFSGRGNLLIVPIVRPPKLFAGGPHLMHDNRELAGNRNVGFLHAGAFGNPHAPSFEC